MKKLSVIIPIYNTREYLRRCLDSICNQTYSNLEIICIDDGSSDGSEKILDEYKENDPRIIAVHKINGGESSARNEGIRRVTGDYVTFVDCDDWIQEDMYKVLIDALEAEQADMAIGSWYKDEEESSVAVTNKKIVREAVFGQSKLLFYVYERDAYQSFAYMWDKIYKKELLQNQKGEWLFFDESLKLGGDVIYLAQMILNVKKAVYVDKPFYHYIQRIESGCHSVDLSKRMDWLKAYEIVIDLFEKNDVEERVIDLTKRFMAYHSSNVAEMAYQQKNEGIMKKCQKIMSDYKKEYEILNSDYVDRLQRYESIMKYQL